MGERLHDKALTSFSKTVAQTSRNDLAMAPTTATAFGLFEISIASASRPSFLSAHVGGIAALLQAEADPLSLLRELKKVAVIDQVFSIPSSSEAALNLESAAIESARLREMAKLSMATSEVKTLIVQATDLGEQLACWDSSRDAYFRHVRVGHIEKTHGHDAPPVGCWPCPIDSYVGLYIAAVWNVYRTLRCSIMSYILMLSERIAAFDAHEAKKKQLLLLVNEVISSIPYHLVEHLHVFQRGQDQRCLVKNCGRTVGGLFLVQPLALLCQMEQVAQEKRAYFQKCLE